MIDGSIVPPQIWRAIWLVTSLASAVIAGAETAEIRWQTESLPNAIEVHGVSSETLAALSRKAAGSPAWSKVFAVFAEPPDAAVGAKTSLLPMAGNWQVERKLLRFEPRFPLAHGVRYRAEYRPQHGEPLISFFERPAAKLGVPTEVVQVFPSSAVLPENQLKFYVQFSAPMSRGGTYEHVHIRDAEGSVIDLPFLELDEELWDLPMTRLTLLIDPGRIKRGVKPLEDIGPVFESGKNYSLTLETQCRDATGQPLRQTFEKKFRIGPADRTPPDPQRWTIDVPKSGTREPLIVKFDEPMDQALALRLIRVVTGTPEKPLRGDTMLAREEQEWRFTPDAEWVPGRHRLRVATTIEDLAGNNIGKTFDVDLAATGQRRVADESVRVEFEVK